MEYRVLFIDFNSYFASVEQQLRPELRGRPIAVVPVVTDSTCAIAASYEAKAFGVKTGTRIYEARQMCPGLVCVPARHEAYVHYHHKLIEEVDKYLPILKVCSIDEMACELYGRFRQESEALGIAARIKAGITQNIGVCLTSSIGLSTNQYLAKVASDLKKPNGVTCLHPSHLPGKLQHLKLTDFPGIGKNMSARLSAKGILTFDQLWNCAPKQLRGIWGGVGGERFWHALRGEEGDHLESRRTMITHSHVLSPEDRPVARAENVGRRLLLKAASRMRKLNLKATRLDLSARIENGPRLEGHTKFPEACDSFALLKVFAALWRDVLQGNTSRIKKVSLALHGLVDASAPEQLLLLPSPDAPSPEEKKVREDLSRVIDQLTQRYGRNAVTLGLTENDGRSFTGTKIAFNRIPEPQDFEQWNDTTQGIETGPYQDDFCSE